MEKLKQHIINKEESVIAITGLYKSFDDLQVLKGIDFNLFKGENIAVLGKSGTGKSVLIKIIVGLLKPDQGEVLVLGKHVDQLKTKELDALRLRIGFSFQNSALYDSMNVYQNLAFPLTMNMQHLSKNEVKNAVDILHFSFFFLNFSCTTLSHLMDIIHHFDFLCKTLKGG